MTSSNLFIVSENREAEGEMEKNHEQSTVGSAVEWWSMAAVGSGRQLGRQANRQSAKGIRVFLLSLFFDQIPFVGNSIELLTM